MYRRRQRLFVEMEQMASRPFSQVCVELDRGAVGKYKNRESEREKKLSNPASLYLLFITFIEFVMYLICRFMQIYITHLGALKYIKLNVHILPRPSCRGYIN